MTGEKSKAPSPTQIFTEYLRRTRRRRTPERYMVLECAETCQGHFTADELCVRLEEASRHVARATVYSTLQLLEECGIVMRHRFKDQRNVYELTPTHSHHHLICTRCGRIKDVRDAQLAEVLRTRRYSAFTPSAFALSVYGVCSACMRRARSESRKNKNNKPNPT